MEGSTDANVLTIEEFYSSGIAGTLLGLECPDRHVTVPPRRSCRLCGSLDLRRRSLSGSGAVISFTEVYSKSKEFPVDVPYTFAIVSLDEGGKLMGIVDKESAFGLKYGTRVRTRFRKMGEKEWPRIFFEAE